MEVDGIRYFGWLCELLMRMRKKFCLIRRCWGLIYCVMIMELFGLDVRLCGLQALSNNKE